MLKQLGQYQEIRNPLIRFRIWQIQVSLF